MKIALIVGATVGAAVALLYAPRNGAATRTYLANKARVGQKRASALVTKGFDAVETGRTHLMSAVEAVSDSAARH